jgi:hypothetical protein
MPDASNAPDRRQGQIASQRRQLRGTHKGHRCQEGVRI